MIVWQLAGSWTRPFYKNEKNSKYRREVFIFVSLSNDDLER